jgi:hypothetical protein
LSGKGKAAIGLSHGCLALHPVHADRLRDVLDLLIAQIIETQRELVAYVIARRRRDTDRARLGESFEAGGDIDPVAEQVAAVNHDIADMHANAELHWLGGLLLHVHRRDRRLHRDRALDSIHRAGEISDNAVAGGVEDPTAV